MKRTILSLVLALAAWLAPSTLAQPAPDRIRRLPTFADAIARWSAALGPASSGPLITPAGGRTQLFARGRIYWHASTGARVLMGPVLSRYMQLGGPGGRLGYPTSDLQPLGANAYAMFARGAILHSARGTFEVHGRILQRYRLERGHTGWLGFPTSDVRVIAPGRLRSTFTGGWIDDIAGQGATAHRRVQVARGTMRVVRPAPADLAAVDFRFRLSGSRITFLAVVKNVGTTPVRGPGTLVIGVGYGSRYRRVGVGQRLIPAGFDLAPGRTAVLPVGVSVPFSMDAHPRYNRLDISIGVPGDPQPTGGEVQSGKSNNALLFFSGYPRSRGPRHAVSGQWLLASGKQIP